MPMNHSLQLSPDNWAVIFISEREENPPGYADMDQATMDAVSAIPGFLGWESARQSPTGIFISYWENEEAIQYWRDHELHKQAKGEGRRSWYTAYRSVVCKVCETHYFRRES